MPMRTAPGFTLSELMIALALMGVIAIFTVPKVLGGLDTKTYNSSAKGFVVQLQAAYADYQQENQPDANSGIADVTPYMNYVKFDSTNYVLDYPDGTNTSCDAAGVGCVVFHDGSRARIGKNSWGYNFGGTTTTNAAYVYYDPDGKDSNVYAIQLFLYYDGEVRSGSTHRTPTCDGGGCNYYWTDPSWFDWTK